MALHLGLLRRDVGVHLVRAADREAAHARMQVAGFLRDHHSRRGGLDPTQRRPGGPPVQQEA